MKSKYSLMKKQVSESDIEDEEIYSESEEETEIDNEVVDEDNIEESSVEETTEDITDISESINNKPNRKVVDKSERITDDFMSFYEYVRALCIRSKQIMLGSKIMLKDGELLRKKYTPKEIAKMEIDNKCCPLIIIRELPNGNVERWSINELENFY